MNVPSVLMILCVAGCTAHPAVDVRPGVTRSPAAEDDGIAVYFSPNGGAMAAVIAEIGKARESVDVQAYLITSADFVEALKAAVARGVRVRVILDANGFGGAYSAYAFFAGGTVPVWRDGQHKDAHDKVVLLDGRTLVTGSLNFTDQSDAVNAENLLVIRDKPTLVAAYLRNFENHLAHASPFVKP